MVRWFTGGEGFSDAEIRNLVKRIAAERKRQAALRQVEKPAKAKPKQAA